MEHEEDQDSLFGSPPPSPRSPTTLFLPSASICDNERRLSTSTDTQNVGTIALPGSHNSELPLNPLALSLNHNTGHRPPAQSEEQLPIAKQNTQPLNLPPVQNSANENGRSSQSPFSNVPPRDPEFSLPDPSGPPPAHFLRNQQNLLGKAGLVAGVKPSTIAHIRGTSFNPITIDDEDTPIIGRKSRDSRHCDVDPSVLTTPTNEDILSILISQKKDIAPILEGILGILGKKAARSAPATTSILSRNDFSKQPPVKKRKLDRVPAGAADWDVPYPFQEGEGPDRYYETWERKRAKDLVAQLVKLIKVATRKAAIKNHTSVSSSRSSTPGLEDFKILNTMGNGFDSTVESPSASNSTAVPYDIDALIASMLHALPQDQGVETTPFPSSLSSSQQPSLIGDDAIDPVLLALSMQPGSDGNHSIMSQAVSPVPSMSSSSGAGPMTPPLSSAWDPDIFTGFSQGVFRPTLWNNFSQGAYQGSTEGGGWDEVGQIGSDFWSGMTEEGSMTPMVGDEGKGKGKEVLRTDPLEFSSADATIPIQESPCNTLMGTQPTDIVLPPSYEQPEHTTPVPIPIPAPPQAPRPKTTTISQTRKEEILRGAREKQKQVREELDRIKKQLWETTIEQAALVHLLKRYENE